MTDGRSEVIQQAILKKYAKVACSTEKLACQTGEAGAAGLGYHLPAVSELGAIALLPPACADCGYFEALQAVELCLSDTILPG